MCGRAPAREWKKMTNRKRSKSLYLDRKSMNRCLKDRHASNGQNGKPESTRALAGREGTGLSELREGRPTALSLLI